MNDFFHIHLPFGDEAIEAIEKAFGIKFLIVPSEKVEVCLMSPSSGRVDYMELKSNL